MSGMQAERDQRYQELRARAATLGLTLPEMPPWGSGRSDMPEPPEMPSFGGMTNEQMDAIRKEREAMREQMRTMTPEERQAAREAHWNSMRERAAQRGVEMPETPPWVEAQKRRQQMQEEFEKYRKTVDEMSEEQRKAAEAVFGQQPQMPQRPCMQGGGGPGFQPFGGYPGGPMNGPGQMGGQGGPGAGWGPRMVPYYGMPRPDQGPPPPDNSGGR